MNVSRRNSNAQGRFPTLRKGAAYRQTLEALLVDGARMAGIDPVAVAKVFHRHGIDAVFIGGLVIGCLTGRPRTTRDIDVIAGVERISHPVLTALGKAVASRTVERHPSFLSFTRKTAVGAQEVLDVITSKAGSYGLVFTNHLTLTIAGVALKIPTPEMMIVLKYTAAMNPVRSKAKQHQDWADLYAIIDANPGINRSTLKLLANEVVPGFGDDLYAKFQAHRRGR